MTPRDTNDAFSIGPWQVFPRENRLTRDVQTVDIEPRVMSVLVCLSNDPGRIVSVDSLVEKVWGGRAHSDHAIYQAIASLRKALGDDASKPTYIETIPKKGYRLICPVSALNPAAFAAWHQRRPLSRSLLAITAAGIALLASLYFLTDYTKPDSANNSVDRVMPEVSIAVLPFVNLGEAPDSDFFSDGLSEELLNLLAKVPDLKVIAWSSSSAFRNADEDRRTIGERLGVVRLLQGSVRQDGEQLRVTAQLVDTRDGSYTWSETYERTTADIFDVQSEVAAAIIEALQLHVGANPARERPTESRQAYTMYLKARSMMNNFELQSAEALLLKAVDLDPEFAEAYELLAVLYFRQAGASIDAATGQRLCGEAAAKALSIDPDLVLARALYEAGNVDSWSYAGELAALDQAAKLLPNNAELLYTLQWDLLVTGYLRESVEVAERLIELDPLSRTANSRLTEALYATGRIAEAIAALELQAELGDKQAVWDLGEIQLIEKQYEEAFAYFEAFERTSGYSDPHWVRDFVRKGRDPDTGENFLAHSISNFIAEYPEDEQLGAHLSYAEWYLYLDYLDRFYEIIFSTDPGADSWSNAEYLMSAGTLYRKTGFTAHPRYLELAESMGFVDVWEQRGPPDFCRKTDGEWVCE